MADQGRWFKLWVTADDDPDLSNLSLEDFARWCLMGIYLKKHGTNGTVTLCPPCPALQSRFKVQTFEDVVSVIQRFPNCDVSSATNPIVTWRNWRKYQGDFSTERVKKFREMKRSKKRGEEKRREEKRISSPSGDEAVASRNGFADWPEEWHPVKAKIETLPFLARHQHWLADLAYWISEDEKFAAVKAPITDLLTAAAAFCQRDGYVPRSKRGLLKKLHNCMEFEARRVDREGQRTKGASERD